MCVYKYTCAYMYISLCMSVFICVYMCLIMFLYVCMHMCTHIVLCTYLSICMQISVCTNKHMHVYTWVCVVCACICAFMCEHLCMYSVYICAYMCVCICVKDKDDFVHVNYLSLLSKVKSGSTSRSQSAWRPHNSLTLVKEDSLISSWFVFMISLSFSLCF